jgi:hypothetical protein
MFSTGLTYTLSIIALLCYFIYIIGRHGTLGFLFSAAIFLIIASFTEHIEYITIGLLIVGLTLSIYRGQHSVKTEGFKGKKKSDDEDTNDEQAEVEPLSMDTEEETTTGVASNKDINTYDKTNSGDKKDVNTANSSNANAKDTSAVNTDAIAKGVTGALATLSAAAPSKAAAQPSVASTAGSSENFQEPSAGLFKLGQLPSEMKQGPFVDVASTMSKAMNSLQPEQMAAMTAESQSLLDTQKNLMNMLQSMRPVLQDGRQLLDTFGSIFGGLGGLAGGKVEGKP